MNYTLHQLKIFLKVSELESITKAAEELHSDATSYLDTTQKTSGTIRFATCGSGREKASCHGFRQRDRRNDVVEFWMKRTEFDIP